ncbi:hypothetical protein [Streptomyces zagrosensis]|uniref:Uncharacterized protein n=1 Tax=Streptomyces zagrosensis TaxID=1042984 RepID=A0A7W9QBA8_9ACTN|nr:hypothetical protein [Streptomyces zagrosensis]MBB5936613.1 hypothetical protein [Streptomyces zagrosensis]
MTAPGTTWFPPPCDEVMMLPAGREWDAVRTSTAVAEWAFEFLDDSRENSAAIMDAVRGCVYWLMPKGVATRASLTSWQRLRPHVTLITGDPAEHYVGVPPSHRRFGAGLHWRIPRNWSGRYLAHPYQLAAFLAPAVIHIHGPEALTLICPVCDQEVDRATAVKITGRHHPNDPAVSQLTVHPACARTNRKATR